jgi:hypothetical protein
MEELEQGIVFRLASVKDTFPPDSDKLHVGHLELSERDKEEKPPRLSVFDCLKTSVAEAREIRSVPGDSLAFGLRVEDIRAARVAGVDPLRVVRDPLKPPQSEMPGASGHCGILGLDRKPGQSKQLFREIRVLLADMSFRYNEWDCPRPSAASAPSKVSEPDQQP